MAAGRTAGWFDASEDMDWYRLDLAAGQRFHVELQGGRLGDQRPLMKLVSPTGEVLNLTPALHAGPSDMQDFSAVGPVAGSYSLLVAAPPATWPGAPLPLPYQLSVSNIGADAEPDRRVDALRLVPDQPRSASFDQTGDRDTFAVDAVAGQRVLFEVYGIGFQVSSYAARLYGPGDTDTGIATLSSLSQIRFVSTIEQSGRFTLDLQSRAEIGGPATAVPVGYTVTAHLLPADDHAGTFGAAEALAVGQTARGVLDLPGDLDAFAVDLVAGQRYGFELATGVGSAVAGLVALRLYDTAANLLREGRITNAVAAALSFEPETSGRYVLRAEAPVSVTAGALGSGAYELHSALWAADDLPGRLSAAPTLAIGDERAIGFDQAADLDIVRFYAQAGERFTLNLTTAAGAPAAAALAVVDGMQPLPPRLVDSAGGSLQVVATYAGWHYALVSPASAASSASLAGSYRLRVDARGADDHGDAPAVGTPIAVGETASGRVDLGGDIDWFRVDLQAGRRYQFELTIPASDLAIGVAPDLVLADMAGNDLYAAALGARGNAVSRFVFSPAQDGSYALRPAGVASYTLQVDAVAADDVADLAALARPLDVAVTYQALGMVVQGGDAPELFIGGSRDDQFYSDGGADIFSGGPGNDLLDGGAAIDLARYPGTKVDYRLSHGAGSWAVQDLRGALGTDTLVGVERLAFEGSPTALALDLDGQAGVVAKLIGALFGPAWLARADVVGVGLAALPTMSPLELAQVAVTSDLFASEVGSHSNRDFVFAVYTHVFGRPPANADLQAYTALLDRGEYTQATLALAAADAPQNLVNIDFVGLQAGGIEYLPG